MILSIGEILADMVGSDENGTLTFKAFCGGAPFNVAVNAKKAGANVGFVGRVGKDVIGRFVISEAEKANLDYLDVQLDEERNTTIAFVSLKEGERDFAFNRHDTADFNIDFDKIDFGKFENLKIIHLGSLMLSEKAGKVFAEKVAKYAKAIGKKLSFDMNFRMDTYKDFSDAVKAYKPFVDCADIIKFSDDELRLYTGMNDLDKAAQSVVRNDQLLLLTMGGNGSRYYYGGDSGTVSTKMVKPIDTTGAGDAFFGTFLAKIEHKDLTKENLENALKAANEAGARATQFFGAIQL